MASRSVAFIAYIRNPASEPQAAEDIPLLNR